jgi:excisionase family DNA binding protein
MDSLTFESLPKAVSQLCEDMAIIKQHLLQEKEEPKQPAQDELLTIQQTAELLNLSVPTIYGLVHRRAIPVMKRTKRLYFSRQSIMDYIKSGRRKSIFEITAEAESHLNKYKRG